MSGIDALNSDCFCFSLDCDALAHALDAELGTPGLAALVHERCPTLFAAQPVFVSPTRMADTLRWQGSRCSRADHEYSAPLWPWAFCDGCLAQQSAAGTSALHSVAADGEHKHNQEHAHERTSRHAGDAS